MYICMYVCMYLCMYVCMYVCKYVYMYVCMYVCHDFKAFDHDITMIHSPHHVLWFMDVNSAGHILVMPCPLVQYQAYSHLAALRTTVLLLGDYYKPDIGLVV